jgi:hypothetical protein
MLLKLTASKSICAPFFEAATLVTMVRNSCGSQGALGGEGRSCDGCLDLHGSLCAAIVAVHLR